MYLSMSRGTPPQALHHPRHELRLGDDGVRQQPFEPQALPLGAGEGDGLVERLVPEDVDGFLGSHHRGLERDGR